MSSHWVEQYVQQRINEARKELASEWAATDRPVINKQVGAIDRIAERIASRVRPAIEQRQRQSGYIGRPESSRPGYQGMYADELFRRSGFYANEWERLHGKHTGDGR